MATLRQSRVTIRSGGDHYGSPPGFLRFASGFWSAQTARPAWLLVGAIIILLLANLGVNIGLNRWHRWFFDTLERRDTKFLPIAITALSGLIIAGAGVAALMVKCRMTFQLRCVSGLLRH
jgi:vitamin B12/bleomycin/antimicrobial peptide transport system ATP-binding/permease protein